MSKLDPTSGHSAAGRSVAEMIQDDLDEETRVLMDPELRESMGELDRAKASGVAYGLARALGTLRHPYDPEVGLHEERQAAMARWRASQEDEEG